jgi:hypothetical protein
MKMTDVYSGALSDARTFHLRRYDYYSERRRRNILLAVQLLLSLAMLPLPLLITDGSGESDVNGAGLLAILLAFLIVHSLLDAFFGNLSSMERELVLRKEQFSKCPNTMAAFFAAYRDSQADPFLHEAACPKDTVRLSTVFDESSTGAGERKPIHGSVTVYTLYACMRYLFTPDDIIS